MQISSIPRRPSLQVIRRNISLVLILHSPISYCIGFPYTSVVAHFSLISQTKNCTNYNYFFKTRIWRMRFIQIQWTPVCICYIRLYVQGLCLYKISRDIPVAIFVANYTVVHLKRWSIFSNLPLHVSCIGPKSIQTICPVVNEYQIWVYIQDPPVTLIKASMVRKRDSPHDARDLWLQ